MKSAARTCTRRLLCAALALVMLIGLSPAYVRADSSGVTYKRATPEAAILNRYTGNSSTLYTQLKGTDAKYPQYNAIGLFGLSYTDQVKDNAERSWKAYDGSVLRDLAKSSGNLEVNLSATLYNREHTHRHAKGLSYYDYTITLWETVRLQLGSGFPTRVTGFNDTYMQTYPRVGDYTSGSDGYGQVRYDKDASDAVLWFTTKEIDYNHFDDPKHCGCGGTYAENMLLTFRDTRAPSLTGVYYSTDGTNYKNRHSGFLVGGGDTLYVKLSFDEPIRFADDSAVDKDGLFVELQADGATTGSGRNAYLMELSGNDLIFRYTFEETDKNYAIAALNLGSLFAEDLPLLQVGGKGSFPLDASLSGDDGTTGFSTTTCYITDLAGNALSDSLKSIGNAKLTLDSEAPYVEKVEFKLALNNADVKEALGKDKWDVNSEQYQKDYTDASDLYLGVGDSINLTIHMNERVQGIDLTENEYGRIIDWKHAVATTNIKDENGDYVTVRSQYFVPTDNRVAGDTAFIMQPVVMQEGWTVTDSNGEIRVTKFELIKDQTARFGELSDTVTDKAGNALNQGDIKIATGANSNPPRLDVTAPTVTENGGYAAEDNGFRYGVTIGDDASGYAGTYGSFILNNGGDGRAYQYQWAVTAEAATTENTVWQTGVTGSAQRFLQTQSVYIHIRPLADETYGDLSGCTLTVKAKDFAGNESNVTLPPEDGTLAWYIDNLAPAARAGEVTRALNSDGSGALTAQVILTDSKGISAWQYAWGDDGETAPVDGWENGAVTATATADPVTVTATGTAAEKELFSRYLWVRAKDNSGNKNTSEPICLGQYTYDLREADYALKYSNGITAKADLEVESIGDSVALFFLLKVGDADEYFVYYGYGGDANENSVTGNLFEKTWHGPYTLAENGGVYTLTPQKSGSPEMPTTGNLSVTVLSGPKGAVNSSNGVWTLGDGTYSFSADTIALKVAGTQDNYEGISLTSTSDLGAAPNYDKYSTDKGNYRSSLEGLQFTVKIAADKNGWNYADVDWASSYVEILSSPYNSCKVYLRPGQTASDGSTTQTHTIGACEFPSGIYTATLHLACFAGKSYDCTLDGQITVDTVEPNSNFALSELSYVPDNQGYGIQDNIGTRDILTDGVIRLPMTQQQATSGTTYSRMYPFTITSTDEAEVTILENPYGRDYRFGQYVLQIWSSADPDHVIEIQPLGTVGGTDQSTVKNYVEGGNSYGFVFNRTDDIFSLYLERGKVNTVFMRKVYSNGKTSDVKTVQIQPVEDFVTGTASVDTATKELAFTPDRGVSTAGATAYVWTWQNGENPWNGEGAAVEMTLGADGTWRCPLPENGAHCAVVTVSASGCIWNADNAGETIRERAPWFFNLTGPYGDTVGDRGPEGLTFTDHGDGTYTLSFRVRDDYDTVKNGLKLNIGFNESYAQDSLTLNLKDSYAWTETGVSTTGISSVTAEKHQWDRNQGENVMAYYSDYLDVTIEGSYAPNRGEGNAITDGQTMKITVTATDALGNSASISTDEQTAAYRTPEITGDSLGSDGLTLSFNQLIRPSDSWAWHDADSAVNGFQKEWSGAFPIPGNGSYDLQFTDIFGNQCTQEFTTDKFTVNGKDYSVALDFADPKGDGKSTILTVASKDGYLIFWDKDGHNTIWSGDGYETVRAADGVGNLAGIAWDKSNSDTVHVGSTYRPAQEVFETFGVHERAIRWETTGSMSIQCCGTDGNGRFSLTVYIDDVVSSAPAADVRYYVYALGQEFSRSELEDYITDNGGSVTVTGNVQVWYKTTRSVTPTDGGREYLFTPENYTAGHTFAYADALGNSASVHVTLPAGLTLAAPVNPPEDKTAPNVDVDIYVKRGGSYARSDAFLPTDANITEKFTALGFVQGYSLTVNASDASGFTIAVSGDGAALSGNIITISKAGKFTITVTDQSKNRNETKVTFTVPEKIDNTPPTAKAEIKATGLYGKNAYIQLADDSGAEVVLDVPAGLPKVPETTASPDKYFVGWYKLVLTDNGTTQLVFRDEAGNVGTAAVTVNGIDTKPPALSVRWSPSNEIDSESAPAGPLNTNVTARITSDKAMSHLTVQAGNETDSHNLLVGGAAQSYTIDGQNGPLVTFRVTPEQILVTYIDNYDQPLTFTATAPNGKTGTLTLDGVGTIDKTAPTITETQDPQTRTGCTVPYAVKVTLTPDEIVTSPNYGVAGKTCADTDPLTLTFTANGAYNVRFADEAGNVTIHKVTITGIDRTAPVLTVTKTEENNTVKVTATVNEPCTLTWGAGGKQELSAAGSHEIIFTQNGTFAITATDNAGNESFKMVTVGSIDDVAPTISFTGSTIYVMAGSSADALRTELEKGYTALDNVTKNPTVTIDSGAVDLSKAGEYAVNYTVADAAGNKTTANRFVRVIGADTVCLNIDGELVLPDSTAVLRPGSHTLTLTNGSEPYTVKARAGILSAGQMKYLSGSSISFDEHGGFTVATPGYYTLLVTTQSRLTIRILLYVER